MGCRVQLKDPFYEAWEAEQKAAQKGHGHEPHAFGSDHGQLAEVGTAPYVLVLHKNESVALQTAVSVMLQAGITADVALRLLTTVNQRGQGIVVQGKEEDVKLMAGMFAEIGMKTTVQPAPSS